MPDKMAGKLVTYNIANARSQWNSKDLVSDLPKWRCTLWRNVHSRVSSGIGRYFKVCRYVMVRKDGTPLIPPSAIIYYSYTHVKSDTTPMMLTIIVHVITQFFSPFKYRVNG